MSTATGSVIEVRNVTKRFARAGSEVVAVDNISFAVPEGQFVSIVGPSGCGKSTLLQIVAGLAGPTSGEVLVDGARVVSPQPGKIAVVFQDAMLFPWMTTLENVAFPLDIQGVAKAERLSRAHDMIALVGLADFTDKYPHELSGGMRQRVSIARGLAQRPRIILMDEPFGALDEQTRLKMGYELLRIWEATRKTILFITHSLAEALFLSDVVLVMGPRPGRIIDTITVPLPRPRTYDMVGSEEFGRARNHIWHLIAGDDSAGTDVPPPTP